MKKVLCSLIIGFVSLLLAILVFPQSVIAGPMLITASLFSVVYALFSLYQVKPKLAEYVFEVIVNALMWP
ncbi:MULTISPECIES: hypothetical protein [unclassified Streptococcus]|uniref:hypothetical protein n=1 Tax=unclassified Streptococcus TaxID=2608887 RepID=UPI00359F0C31